MAVGMVHNFVARIVQGLHRFRIFLSPVAHKEEGGVYAVSVQNVDEGLGVLIAPGRVKGQGYHLVIPLHAVYRQLPCAGGGADNGGAVHRPEHQDYHQNKAQRGKRALISCKVFFELAMCSLPGCRRLLAKNIR